MCVETKSTYYCRVRQEPVILAFSDCNEAIVHDCRTKRPRVFYVEACFSLPGQDGAYLGLKMQGGGLLLRGGQTRTDTCCIPRNTLWVQISAC